MSCRIEDKRFKLIEEVIKVFSKKDGLLKNQEEKLVKNNLNRDIT